VDVWYPARDEHRGEDFDESKMDQYEMLPGTPPVLQHAVRDAESLGGTRALVVFSHGFGGERRQSTFFYTHLASHGYVVAAMDHVGNTTADMISGEGGAGDDAVMERFVDLRPRDVSFVIDRMLARESALDVDADRIGLSGHSFGGWTTLMTAGTDARIRAALPLAPSGGRTAGEAGPNAMIDSLDFAWVRPVPTLYLVGELDSVLPLDGMLDLFGRTPEPKTGVILLNADHFHFNDNIEQTHDGFKMMMGMMAAGADEATQTNMEQMLGNMKSSDELCPGEHAYQLINGLGLAHFDAHLQARPEAALLLAGDLEALMAGRGVQVRVM
jgi:predicted dienelactone hydrolase